MGDWDNLASSNVNFTSTAFFYQNVERFSQIARLLNYDNDYFTYYSIAMKIKDFINSKFFNDELNMYVSGTQCEQAFGLAFDLVPSSKRADVLRTLVKSIQTRDKNHFTVGMFGLKTLLPVLTRNGFPEVADTLMSQMDYPSFGYMLSKGATSVWEVWFFSDNVFSHDHPMFGAPSQWLYSLGGIQPIIDISIPEEDLAYGRIEIRPTLLPYTTWVNTTINSVRGPISSWWERTGDNQVTFTVIIPPNCKADIYLPTQKNVISVGSGKYSFRESDSFLK